VVLAAGQPGSERAEKALDTLCREYWQPLYTYVRRRGHSPEDAQDLTQEFFARWLKKNLNARADPRKGRFRSFLLASMNHFLADEWQKSKAQKRGAGKVAYVDLERAERLLQSDTQSGLSAELAFDRQWALAVLQLVYTRLEREYRENGKDEVFSALRGVLMGAQPASYKQLSASLKLTEGAIKAAVHRLRHRYRQVLRETVSLTVERPSAVDDELRYLLKTLS